MALVTGPLGTLPRLHLREESEEIDVLERRFVLKKHKRQKYRCGCGQCIETAPGPVKLFAGARYSVNFAVHVAMAKYTEHLPLARQVRTIAAHGHAAASKSSAGSNA